MGWAGIPLDIATVMIASIVLGLAGDDTIHTVDRFASPRPVRSAGRGGAGALDAERAGLRGDGARPHRGLRGLRAGGIRPHPALRRLSALAIALAALTDLVVVVAALLGRERPSDRGLGREAERSIMRGERPLSTHPWMDAAFRAANGRSSRFRPTPITVWRWPTPTATTSGCRASGSSASTSWSTSGRTGRASASSPTAPACRSRSRPSRPLNDFGCVAFSVSFEEDYVNLLQMLDRARIPLRRRDRGPWDPVIVLGGSCASINPLPMSEFVDVFALGAAENVLPDLLAGPRGGGRQRRR